MKNILLSGNQAIARGAIESGVKLATSYPGTPASDILEYFMKNKPDSAYAEWSTNEKVAFEVALGGSLLNQRVITIMKCNGIDWIMDIFNAVTYTGIRGGFVVIVADDPGAHFSVTEKDSRPIAPYLNIPCLEPSDPQECKDMTVLAFEISEKFELPVLIRTTNKVLINTMDGDTDGIPMLHQDQYMTMKYLLISNMN